MKIKVATIVLLVVGLLAACSGPGKSVSIDPDSKGVESDIVVEGVVAHLRAQEQIFGPVRVESGQVILLDGRVRLSVTPRDDKHASLEPGVHFHVLAQVPEASQAGLDACIFGVGSGRDTKLASIGELYVTRALAPIWSRLKEDELLESSRFHGTDSWGIGGRRGFAGPITIVKSTRSDQKQPGDSGNGSEEEAITRLMESTPWMLNLPHLPDDGKMHLLKIVLIGRDGAWRRSIELDGEPTLVTDEPFTGNSPPIGDMSLIQFAVFDRADTLSDNAARSRAMHSLGAQPAWLPAEETCPLDVMPMEFKETRWDSEMCTGGRLEECLRECERGGGESCYGAAQDVLREEREVLKKAQSIPGKAQSIPGSQLLFMRACQLGEGSGCTNAAAGRIKKNGEMDDCSFKTFGLACDRASEPWACTMFGKELAIGPISRRNPVLARKVLARSCRNGTEDAACSAAGTVLKLMNE